MDFLISKEKKPILMIEVKLSDEIPSKSFKKLASDLDLKRIQLVLNAETNKDYPFGVSIRNSNWLFSVREHMLSI